MNYVSLNMIFGSLNMVWVCLNMDFPSEHGCVVCLKIARRAKHVKTLGISTICAKSENGAHVSEHGFFDLNMDFPV